MLINLDGEDYYLVYEKSKPQTGSFWDLSRLISSMQV